tara:strand:+ start:277 stop:663 length:387 start_codon:yes stop_codon:yes gene_type:complete
MKTVYNLQDLLSLRGCGEETFEQLKRNVYKYTSCGAYVAEVDPPDKPKALLLSSIVEGVGDGTEIHCLYYPFTIDQFQDALQAVEDEASEIWKATHGCEDCDPEMDSEQGFAAINPDCKTCEGEGVII